jgi:hypothetical protein
MGRPRARRLVGRVALSFPPPVVVAVVAVVDEGDDPSAAPGGLVAAAAAAVVEVLRFRVGKPFGRFIFIETYSNKF